MGMNLYGNNPSSHVGKIYRSSIWIWHPMWNYFEINYPEVAKDLGNGHANDGDELDNAKSIELANIIINDLSNGKINEYLQNFENFLNSLPETICEYCLGFGKERVFVLQQTEENCFRCNGSGKSKMMITNYRAYTHDFYKLADFLRSCGGFKIL